MDTKDIVYAVEHLRKELHLTESDLCEGLISTRTYRRYLYGESKMSMGILESLLSRLHKPLYAFLFEVGAKVRLEDELENTFLNHLFNDRFEEAKTLHNKVDLHHIQSSRVKLLLPLYYPKYQAYLGFISEIDAKKMQFQALNLTQIKKDAFIPQSKLYLLLDLIESLDASEYLDVIELMNVIIENYVKVIPYNTYYIQLAMRIRLLAYLKLQDHTINLEPIMLKTLEGAYDHFVLPLLYECLNDVYEYVEETTYPKVKKMIDRYFISSLLIHPDVTLGSLQKELKVDINHLIYSHDVLLDLKEGIHE